jgi:hypothetical protein
MGLPQQRQYKRCWAEAWATDRCAYAVRIDSAVTSGKVVCVRECVCPSLNQDALSTSHSLTDRPTAIQAWSLIHFSHVLAVIIEQLGVNVVHVLMDVHVELAHCNIDARPEIITAADLTF